MIVLAIETSCDETAAAVLCSERGLLASEVASQIAIHQAFGGVVPEVASRNHLTQLRPVIETALRQAKIGVEELDAVAATAGPGLATSLMIGTSSAKGLALGLNKPFLAINHMEGHLVSPFFPQTSERGEPSAQDVPIGPAVGLIVSGGHTMLVDIEAFGRYKLLGRTHDDAAGEAFDKVGKLLGLPYPAGPVIDRLARSGNPKQFDFPRSMIGSGDFHFSFSGLKTSVRYLLPKLAGTAEYRLEDLCASFQEAVVDVLVSKTIAATKSAGRTMVALSGGVSCNSRLRERMAQACVRNGLKLLVADPALCTDNAAMIAFVALQKMKNKSYSLLSADIDPNLQLV
ncbi:MAG: tRNA (adenosine(37)-N6)-threonylcarbamoyltransferase complex transferase subunit TsaD [Verrucomicrobiota bacterium]